MRRARPLAATVALVAIASTVLSSACLMGPSYRRPEIRPPDAHRGQEAAVAASLADRPWWEIFQDPALGALIDEALKNNADVRVAAWRVEEFRARVGIARADLYPRVGYSGQVAHGRQSDLVSGDTNGPTGTVFSVDLGLSWEIDLWGRVRRLSESALARYFATEEARRGVMVSVVSQVADAYFQLRELDERLEIARRTTDAFQSTYDLFNRQLTGGVASGLEVARAEAALGIAASQIPDLERQIVAQENLLAFLVGRNPGPIARGAPPTEQPLPVEVPAGLPSALLERRFDVRESEQLLVAANAEVGAAIAAEFPALSLTGTFGGVSAELSDLFGTNKAWQFAANVTGPIFQGGRLRNQVRANRAAYEQAAARYDAAVRNAFSEVSTALVAHAKLAEVERQQARSVAAYREAVRLANIRYTSGLSSYVEVLDAQQQLFPTENALARTRSERLTNFVALYRALGGGWNVGERSPSPPAPPQRTPSTR
jgi:outer membrane protein, multidrug efflux system